MIIWVHRYNPRHGLCHAHHCILTHQKAILSVDLINELRLVQFVGPSSERQTFALHSALDNPEVILL